MQLEATTQTCCKKAGGTGVGEVGAETEAGRQRRTQFSAKAKPRKASEQFFFVAAYWPQRSIGRRRRSVVVALVRPGTELRLCNCDSDWGLAKQGLATFWGIQQQMPNGKLAKTFERVATNRPLPPPLLDASLLWPVL